MTSFVANPAPDLIQRGDARSLSPV